VAFFSGCLSFFATSPHHFNQRDTPLARHLVRSHSFQKTTFFSGFAPPFFFYLPHPHPSPCLGDSYPFPPQSPTVTTLFPTGAKSPKVPPFSPSFPPEEGPHHIHLQRTLSPNIFDIGWKPVTTQRNGPQNVWFFYNQFNVGSPKPPRRRPSEITLTSNPLHSLLDLAFLSQGILAERHSVVLLPFLGSNRWRFSGPSQLPPPFGSVRF